jgi:myosin-7
MYNMDFKSFYAIGWCVGTVERTEEKGDFPAEAVYVLPCLTKPPADILV